MLFPTVEFAVFFAAVFPITWALNESNTTKKWFLVFASLFFYGFWSVFYLPLLVGSAILNFALALLIAWAPGRLRLALLWLGIVLNLGVLTYFKYFNFFVATIYDVAASLNIPVSIGFIETAIPIAISFLTFHVLAYLIDVYHRRLPPSKSLGDVLLYVSFFPHLIAGPIVRPAPFLAQTAAIPSPSNIKLGFCTLLIIGGLFKKVIIANYLATDFVDGVFRNPQDYSSLDLLLGTYAYAIQIYCDFSAYTDIAIGVAGLLGYEFPQNFNQPYRATSLQDFWRRWHITLSTWLRDYLYIPLGGSRGTAQRTCANLLITMGLGGLWHGASFNFLIWGLIHGVALVVERLLGFGSGKVRWWLAPLAWLVTFHVVCLAWIFFRAPTLDTALAYLGTMLTANTWTTTMTPLVATVLALGALTQFTPGRLFELCERGFDRAPLVAKVAVPAAVILIIAMAAPNGVPPFIYFQF